MSRGECPLDSCLVLSLRHEGDEGAEGDERGKGHRAGEEGIAILLGGNSVSYTHLTLPTN